MLVCTRVTQAEFTMMFQNGMSRMGCLGHPCSCNVAIVCVHHSIHLSACREAEARVTGNGYPNHAIPRRISAVGGQRVAFTDALQNAIKANQAGNSGKTSSQWYCGGPRSSYMYRPPHHRYRTEKTISKLLLQADGSMPARAVPTDIANTPEIR